MSPNIEILMFFIPIQVTNREMLMASAASAEGKPMVLSPAQVRDLVKITGTAIFSDWIGHALVLTLPRDTGASEIELLGEAGQGERLPSAMSSYHFDLTGWLLAILIVIGLGIVSLAYVQQNGQALWETILALFG